MNIIDLIDLNVPGTRIKNDNSGWLVVIDLDFHIDETGDYEFTILKADDSASIYLSNADQRLSLDPDTDSRNLLNHMRGYYTSWEVITYSSPRRLIKGKKYHICLAVYNKERGGNGESYPGIRKVGGSFSIICQKMIIKNGVSYEDLWKSQLQPDFFEIPYIDTYSENGMIPSKTGRWNVYIHPAGMRIINTNHVQGSITNKVSVTSVLTDFDPTTEFRANWWSRI